MSLNNASGTSTASSRVKVSLLNHASMLIEAGEIRLLTDPWYSGTRKIYADYHKE